MKWLLAAVLLPFAAQAQPVGDAMPQSLTGRPGDPARGAALLGERQKSLCVLCHAGPLPNPHLQGNLAPDLSGVGARLSVAQLRLRVVDMKWLNPASIMPSYGRISGGGGDADRRIAAAWRGKPILTAAEIEDIVAFLATLKD